MTTIMPNAFMVGDIHKNIKSALRDVDNCLTAITDSIDYARLTNAKDKLKNAVETMDKMLEKGTKEGQSR